MRKKLTITVDAQVYEGLHRVLGRRHISGFIEALVRPHVIGVDLDESYRQMAQAEEREAEALEWMEATIADSADEPRSRGGTMRNICGVALALAVTVAFLIPARMSAQAPASEGDPEEVVRAFVDALNGGDADGAAALLTDTAIRVRQGAAGLCSRLTPCVGRDEILASLQLQVAAHECQTIVDLTVSGSVVTGRYEAQNDNNRRSGIERVIIVFMVLVEEGKIAALYALPDLADSQTAANTAIAAGTQAPGAAIPNPATACG